jgi:glycosyltransferase involved in cell wall biosynthesis
MEDVAAKRITCEFIPRWSRNPYHRQLIECLKTDDVTVGEGRELKALVAGIKRGETRPDIVHLHATPPFGFHPARFGHYVLFHLRLWKLRQAGSKIVWTIHDACPHESKWGVVDMRSGRLLAEWVDHCIVHAPSALEAICQHWNMPGLPRVTIIPHGHYLDVYPNRITRETARQKLGINGGRMVYLFLGLIRPYKGVEVLLEVFAGMKDRTDAMLLVAGQPVNSAIRKTIEAAASRDPRIKFFPGYVRDDEVQAYMNAADVVVFPYRNSLTSGSVIMAMGFKKPCIAPKLGAIKDVLDADGAYLFDATSENAVRYALESAYTDRERLPVMGAHNQVKCRQWSWDMIARETAKVYRQCLSGL